MPKNKNLSDDDDFSSDEEVQKSKKVVKKKKANSESDSDDNKRSKKAAPKKSKKKKDSSDSDSGPEDRGPAKKEPAKKKESDGSWCLEGMRFVKVEEFKGRVFVNIREYYEKDGKTLPGKKGIALSASQWRKLAGLTDDITAALDKY